jgi:tripartite-type tricarboxylate transporter receptor subunit TctC
MKMQGRFDMTHVPYRGGVQAIADLMGGQIELALDGGPHVTPHLKSGTIRALATATGTRLADQPGLPTLAERGFPGFEASAWQSIWVHSATPQPVLDEISRAVTAVL